MRRPCKPEVAVAAALVYVPFLLSSPGRVSADSNQYLYLDPGGFWRRTVDLWDPTTGAGGVPHQHLGYAFPVAPFFWCLDRMGLPDWVAQRLWLGTLTFLALMGSRWLFRQLDTGRVGALAGALVYAFTPYQLAFTARISVLLMPWAALPWIVGLTMRATRNRSWRDPALLGLVLVLAGGINASSLLLVGLAPLLWLLLDASRGHARRVLAASGRVTLIGLGVSLWWLVGLQLQGRYGLPVLQLTENLRTVAERSTPGDVLRGLGNWFFYGRDLSGFSLDQAASYASNRLVVTITYAIPVVGLIAALLLRWTYRTYFCLLVLVGTVVSVGSWPFDDPSPYGRAWKAFTSDTSVGLAFRNSPRAVPIVVLGFAGLLAAAIAAIPRRAWGRAGAGVVGMLALGGLLPVWQGGYLSDGQDRSEQLPDYWIQAGADLDAGDHATRILELPGSTFAGYRWGNLVDPLTPGLTDRPYLAREVLPSGTPASVNLLDALDRRAQLGVLDPASIAPVARLLGVGTVVLRADLEQSNRGFSPPPGPVWDALRRAPGLAPPRVYGPPGGDGTDPHLPSVALFDLESPRRIVRTDPVAEPVVLAGDGDGIVDAAAAGLIDGNGLVLESSALSDDELSTALGKGAHLFLTDSNRRRIQTWFYALRDTRGHTERAGEIAPDPTGYDFRLSPFPATDDDRTVVQQVGGRVDVTSDGGPDRPEDRGANAFDGDPSTSWRVGEVDPRGQGLTIFPDPVPRIDEVTILQAPSARSGRAVRSIRLTVGGKPLDVVLGPESLQEPGQTIPIPEQAVPELQVEVTGVTDRAGTDPAAPVGFAEIHLGSTRIWEVVRLPVDLLDRVGDRLDGVSLDIVLTRLRLDLPGTDRLDDESHLDRTFELPVARSFELEGSGASVEVGAAVARAVCRSDLVEIDGRAVGVQLSPLVNASGGSVTLRSCAPMELGAGAHRLTATPGRISGWDIDQLVLSTDESGQPAADISPRGAASSAAPAVRTTATSAASVTARVSADGAPFWFGLGQSASGGWSLEADGASVGRRTLVDGYANGWLLTPDGPGVVIVHARWEPQRLVWLGLGASGAAVVACGLILLRRRPGARPPPEAVPSLRWPTTAGPRPWGTVVGATVVVGATALLVATPVVAVAGVALTAVAGLVPRGRVVLLAAGPLALVASRVLVERPSLAWLALAAVGADLLLSRNEVTRSPG